MKAGRINPVFSLAEVPFLMTACCFQSAFILHMSCVGFGFALAIFFFLILHLNPVFILALGLITWKFALSAYQFSAWYH